jgi:hypothetical protein
LIDAAGVVASRRIVHDLSAERNGRAFGGLKVGLVFAVCFDQVNSAVRTDRGNHLDVNVNKNTERLASRRIVALPAILVELIELSRSQTEPRPVRGLIGSWSLLGAGRSKLAAG